jgi:hypothetical protein
MIDMPSKYGLADSKIIEWLIRAFYEELWAAVDTDAKRAKLSFITKTGPLQGKAIAIISNKRGSCSGYSPAVPPNVAGSTLFVYTPSAASAFRSTVMSRFFAAQGAVGWSATTFLSEVNKLFDAQLGATLANLIPANQSSLISVDVTTVDTVPAQPNPTPSPPSAMSNASTVTSSMIFLTFVFLAFF